MFQKRKKAKECPEKTPAITKAEQISAQYRQLGSCCNVISSLSNSDPDSFAAAYRGGFRLYEKEITAAGIDIEEVYAHIRKLALKRKLELELELEKLDALG